MSGKSEGSTPEFDEFVASGEVEVGDSNLASQEEEQPKKAAPRRGPPKPAANAAAPAGDEDDQQAGPDDGDEGHADDQPAEGLLRQPANDRNTDYRADEDGRDQRGTHQQGLYSDVLPEENLQRQLDEVDDHEEPG